MIKKTLLVIIGPTAVGKTALSIDLAKRFSGEIISGDSMQIYKTMDIGTAKVTAEEMDNIPHHLIDLKNPDESFSVAEFQSKVTEKITEISSRGKLPIIVGGTGLYINAVLYGYNFTEQPSDEQFRREMEQIAEEAGPHILYERLLKIDQESAAKIHPNNVRRVIRALEVYHCTGQKMSQLEQSTSDALVYDTAIIGLTMERTKLYERINERVEQMLAAGLLDEVRQLYERGIRDCQSIQAIGYKELYKYFLGEITLTEAIEMLKRNSRRYAKRQLTWFRNQLPVEWFDVLQLGTKSQLLKETTQYIEGKLKIKANI